MGRSTTTPVAVQARPKDSLFIPVCVAAMILAAALSVLYASAQESGAGAGGVDRQDQIIEDNSASG